MLLCGQALREQMDLRIYVDVEADRRILRRIERDLVQRGRNFSSLVTQYLETVKSLNNCVCINLCVLCECDVWMNG